MNKRGMTESQLLFITYLMINVLILLGLLFITQREFTGAGALKQYIARDVSLLTNTLSAVNGNIIVNYNTKYPYELSLNKGLSRIKSDRLVDFPEKYPYIEIYNIDSSVKNYDFTDDKKQICSFRFVKENNNIEITRGFTCKNKEEFLGAGGKISGGDSSEGYKVV